MYSDSEDELSEVSTISEDDESDFDDDDEHEYEDEHIFIEDLEHYPNRDDGKYYIGIHRYILYGNVLLFLNAVSPNTYFRYAHTDVLRYLVNYSIIRAFKPKIDIIQLRILPDDTFTCVLKTHWLRLIQRHWKKVVAQRKKVILGRKNPTNRKMKEITGKYPYGLNNIPELRGMLFVYNKPLNTIC